MGEWITSLATVSMGVAIAFPLHAQPSENVDTGLGPLQCIERGTAGLFDCAATSLPAQDAQLGRDASSVTNNDSDGVRGFKFRKVCNNGAIAGDGPECTVDAPLGPGPEQWACTLDTVSGMIWEVKTTTGWRSAARRYTNYSAAYDPAGEFRSATDASGYVDRINREGLCGSKEWGLSHSTQIQTGLDYGAADGPARQDPRFFPNTVAAPYWNGSKNPQRVDTAWAVDLRTGAIDNAGVRSERRPVRVVRGKRSLGGDGHDFTISADGTEATDDARGTTTTWRRCVEGMLWNGSGCDGAPLLLTPEDALDQAAAESARTGVAWHVPNVKELSWTVRRDRNFPATDRQAFPDTPSQNFCTSTPRVDKSKQQWTIDLGIGRVFSAPRTDRCVLRLVRF